MATNVITPTAPALSWMRCCTTMKGGPSARPRQPGPRWHGSTGSGSPQSVIPITEPRYTTWTGWFSRHPLLVVSPHRSSREPRPQVLGSVTCCSGIRFCSVAGPGPQYGPIGRPGAQDGAPLVPRIVGRAWPSAIGDRLPLETPLPLGCAHSIAHAARDLPRMLAVCAI